MIPQATVYQYTIDLNKVENDQLKIELNVPRLKSSKTVFYLPKIVPGTYTNYNFGRFASDFKAFDTEGNEMPVKSLDVNSWEITNARNLARITYLIDDSDDAGGENQVFGMSGTNIEAGENFIINTHGFFGYFKGMKDVPFQLTFSHPENFTALQLLTRLRNHPAILFFMRKIITY